MGMNYATTQRIIDGTGMILDTTPGSPDTGSYVTEQQFADWIRNCTVVKGYYYANKFYSDISHTAQIVPDTSSLYIDLHTGQGLYRWDGAAYVGLTNQIGRYRGDVSTLPSDPVNGDWFFASASFTEGGVNYLVNHMYIYNGATWDDISDVFNQYARQSALDQTNADVAALEDRADTDESNITSLDGRVTVLEQAAQSGYNYKGDCTYANLPTSGQQLGDMWYVTDRNDNYIWNGSVWRPQNNVGWAWVLQADGNYKLGLLEH